MPGREGVFRPESVSALAGVGCPHLQWDSEVPKLDRPSPLKRRFRCTFSCQAMFQGARLAVRHREKVLEKVAARAARARVAARSQQCSKTTSVPTCHEEVKRAFFCYMDDD